MKTYLFIILFMIPVFMRAQSSWKRSTNTVKPSVNLFHSSQTANLPTTETLRQGDFMYEISHRFGNLTSGYDGLYGFDGPVTMRTALSYGVSDRLMIAVGRSNIQDNLDIRLKYKFYETEVLSTPLVMAIQTGIAFNTEVFAGIKKRSAFNSHSRQYYGQLICNTMFFEKRLGAGIVPSLVYNSFIFASDYGTGAKYTFSLPVYLQYYYNRMWSMFIEYNPVVSGWKGNLYFDASVQLKAHNTLATGIAIETGGHVFFLFVTNNERLNPTQYLLGGSGNITDKVSWRMAFGITREL